jgi:hypothetical protein
MPRRQERDELGTAPWNRVLSTHRGELLLEHHDEQLTDHGRDFAIAASSGAQKTGQLLHNLLHDPATGAASSRDHQRFLRRNVIT